MNASLKNAADALRQFKTEYRQWLKRPELTRCRRRLRTAIEVLNAHETVNLAQLVGMLDSCIDNYMSEAEKPEALQKTRGILRIYIRQRIERRLKTAK